MEQLWRDGGGVREVNVTGSLAAVSNRRKEEGCGERRGTICKEAWVTREYDYEVGTGKVKSACTIEARRERERE